jgi:YD repeat-containing protein
MVAIVSGNSLGLTNTSAGVLGNEGLFGNATTGNASEQAYVNVANGNLVLQDQDDYLASIGTDVDLTRTYNSQGVVNGTDAIRQWQTGLERSVGGLTGTINTAGSTLTRVGADGSRTVFSWDGGRAAYIATDGGGAFDSITYNGNAQTYTWHSDAADPNSMADYYDAKNGGRIVTVSEVGGRLPVDVTSGFGVGQATVRPIIVPVESSSAVTTFTLTNNTTAAIAGPINVAITNLGANQTVTNATGYKDGVPYITVNTASVAPGQSLAVVANIQNTPSLPSGPKSYNVAISSGYNYPVTLVYSYNSAGKVASIQDQSGEITSFHYDTRGNLTSVGSSMPAQPGAAAPKEFVRIHYSYDTLNRLTMATVDLAPEATKNGAAQSKSYATSYTYDGISNRIASVTQQDGNVLRFTYTQTSLGAYKVATFTDALNRTTRFAYGDNTTTVTDPKGIKTAYQFDANGNLQGSRITSAAGDETINGPSFTYDAQGNVTSSSDTNGITRYTYDADGSMLTQQNPDGSVVHRTYDLANHQLKELWTEELANAVTNGSFDGGWQNWVGVGTYSINNPGTNRVGNTGLSAAAKAPPIDTHPVEYYAPAIQNGELFFTNPLSPSGTPSGPIFVSASNQFATIPGELYEVSYVARVDTASGSSSGATNYISLAAGSATGLSYSTVDSSVPGTAQYRTYTVRFTATESTSKVDFGMNAYPGDTVAVSDVAVRQIELTRYYYDQGNDKPRFEISPEGRVTEWRYDSTNALAATIVYGTAIAPGVIKASDTTATIRTLVAGFDHTRDARTDNTYDVRGLLQTTTAYAKTDASGNGVADSTSSVTRFVYDQAGQLLQAIDPDTNVTTFTYDGLGRTLSTTDAQQQSTVTTYDDAGNKVTVRLANGLTRISAFDKAGQLLTTTVPPRTRTTPTACCA